MAQKPLKNSASRAPRKEKKDRPTSFDSQGARRSATSSGGRVDGKIQKKSDKTPSIQAPQDFAYFIRQFGSRLLQSVLLFDQPADRCVSDGLKQKEQLHSRDRSAIRSAIFTFLRQRRLIEFWCTKNIYSSQRRFDFALLLQLEASRAPAFFSATELEEMKQAMARPVDDDISLQHNMPPWLYHKLSEQYGDDTLNLAIALNQMAPLDLRANRLQTSRDQLLIDLKERDLPVEPTPYAPDGIRLQIKQSIDKIPLFEQGGFEVQDEASQLVAHLVSPKRGDWVLDFCAGAGGKTLAMGALMQNRGQIMAVDVSATRLKRLHPRLARSGLSNIQTLWVEHENDSRLDKYHHRFDKVLIDAPCTGLGTLRRNPDLKWRQNEMTLKEMVEIQQKLLKRSIAFLKPKGVLVYVTCSILREENQVQVERFLAENPDFCYVDVNELLAKQQIPLSMSQPWFQLWPHQHQTDGFFAAVLTKKSL